MEILAMDPPFIKMVYLYTLLTSGTSSEHLVSESQVYASLQLRSVAVLEHWIRLLSVLEDIMEDKSLERVGKSGVAGQIPGKATPDSPDLVLCWKWVFQCF